MARSNISMARTATARRRRIINHPYSLNQTGANASYMAVGTNVYNFERTDSFSFEFWIKPYDAGFKVIYNEMLTGGTFRGVSIRIQLSVFQFWLLNTFGSNELRTTYNPPRKGVFTHVVCAYGGLSTMNDMAIYYNGVLQTRTGGTETLSATIKDPSAITRWGAFTDGTVSLNGKYMPKRVFNYKLSAAQVADLYYDNLVTGAAALDDYALTEGSGTNVASTGTGAHAGTLTGANITWNTETPMNKTTRTVLPQSRLAVT